MIKFRAWDRKNKVMRDVKGLIWEETNLIAHCLPRGHEFNEWFTVALDGSEYQLMQSTGLKDKNGVEIFEGDIVRRARPCKSEDEIMHIGFANGSFYTTFFPDWCRTSLFSYIEFGNQVEVIGNIYEQPELLGGQA